MRTRTRNDWLAHFAGADVCLTPVNAPTEALNDPHVAARGVANGRARRLDRRRNQHHGRGDRDAEGTRLQGLQDSHTHRLHGKEGALRGYLWGGLVRIFLVHHVTWSVNSVCHFFGRRRFAVDDHSTNVFWLALPSLGESWHHNHHAFPRSARHGLRWWEVDVSGLLIRGLERVGLAWNVVTITPERQRQRLASS